MQHVKFVVAYADVDDGAELNEVVRQLHTHRVDQHQHASVWIVCNQPLLETMQQAECYFLSVGNNR